MIKNAKDKNEKPIRALKFNRWIPKTDMLATI
jgi:hypothetical protein